MSVERVTYRPEGGRARTVYLEGVRESVLVGAPVIMGDEVDRDGLPVLPMGKDGESHRYVIIQTELIVRRQTVRMDKTYGEFVDA